MPPTAVILTTVHTPTLTPYEQISIAQCERTLAGYDKFFVCPQSLDTSFYEAHFKSYNIFKIDDTWQKNYYWFNRLKVVPLLYEAFSNYDFVLFYEPDAFVFKDEMQRFMAKDVDYWGAPWFKGYAYAPSDAPFLGVGNGGLSLRRTAACLKVAKHFEALSNSKEIFKLLINNNLDIDLKSRVILLKWPAILERFGGDTKHFCCEDQFFGRYAAKRFGWLKVAPVEAAASFSFELHPRRLYELNGRALPFGCHAWWKHDLDFWRPFIEEEGYQL